MIDEIIKIHYANKYFFSSNKIFFKYDTYKIDF